MIGRLMAPVLLLTLPGWAMGAQSPRTRDPGPVVAGIIVSVRITHADGQQVDFRRAPHVRRSTTFEGHVSNLPLSASVWLAARTTSSVAAQPWRVLFPPARVEEQGRWLAHVDLPCVPDNREGNCEVLAFVSLRDFEGTPYSEDVLRQAAFAIAGPVTVQVLSADEAASNSITIERLADVAVGGGQPVTVPPIVGAAGSSRDLNGRSIWVAARCDPEKRWFVLGHAIVDDQGSWQLGSLMLPSPLSSRTRRCFIQAVSGPDSPPQPPLTDQTLAAWASARSPAVEISRNPYYLAFLSVTDTSGAERLPPSLDGSRSVIRLAAGLRTIEIESDPLPDDLRIWQLLRCETCSSWLAFGPAQAQGSGRYIFPSPQWRYPGRPSAGLHQTIIVATREDLEGRTLTQPQLEHLAVGASRTLVLDTVARTRPRASVELQVSATGDEDHRNPIVPSSGGMLDVSIRAEIPTETLSVYVGYLDPASTRWFFYRAERVHDGYRVTAPLAHASGPDREGLTTVLVPVVAESLPVDRGLEQEWWSEMVVTVGEPARFLLPSAPLHQRVIRWLAMALRQALSVSTPPSIDSEEVHVLQHPLAWLLAPVAGLLVAAVARWLWQRGTSARAIVNGWLDSRSNRRVEPVRPRASFANVLTALAEANIARIRRRANRPIALLRERLTVVEQRLKEFYAPEFERLKAQTGRRDASMPLSPMQHRFLLFVLTVGESSFNLAVFYVFREPAVYTLLMALAVAISIPICAFSVGLWIRRWRQPFVPITVKLGTTIALLAAALVGLNRVRMAHLGSIAPDFVREHPDLNAAFLSFNALIFLASAMVSYWGHDPEENFAEAKNKVERINARASRLRGQLAAAQASLQDAIDLERERGRYHLALYQTVLERHSSVELGCIQPSSPHEPPSPEGAGFPRCVG